MSPKAVVTISLRVWFVPACLLLFLWNSPPACLAQTNTLPGTTPAPAQPPSESRHPCLLLNAEGVTQLKQRIATAPWASDSWKKLKSAADRALGRPLDLPPRGGNWSHNYVCPTHGSRLTQGQQIGPWQWEHLCPIGDHVLRGDPSKASLDFDGNAIASIHSRYAQQVIDDGLLYQVTGEARYARKAREILLAYAEQYLGYPLHDNQGKKGRGGRIASQSLTEATWLIDMVQGTDLIWNTLTDADRQTIVDKLLRPALDQVILPRRLGIHNIQCRQNSAIGLVGFLLGDKKLIATAVDDPVMGFRQQLENGVRADGMWLEGSSGYHFFTIAGLWPLAEAARNCGLDLYAPKFQSMFDGPLALAMPNFVLPNFNDSGTVSLEDQADAYELAFARFANPAYVLLLTGSERGGRLALLFGVPTLPAHVASTTLASRNSPASGYAILQRGEDKDPTWLCLKYGPHGGGHGHPDKNTFVLFARGQILAPDAGTHAYGSALHRDWDKTTLAHNTLVVDQTSQAQATGKCLAFGSDHDIDYSVTDAGPIYPGVSFTRTAALVTPQIILFVDQVQADAPHTYDLAYHQRGRWTDGPTSAAALWRAWSPPAAPGYSRLTQTITRADGTNGQTLRTSVNDQWQPAIILAPGEATQVITGYGILKTTEDRVPVLLQRRRAQNTAFVWAISLEGAAVTLKVTQVSNAAGQALPVAEAALVQVSHSTNQWSLLVNPHGRKITVTGPGRASWQTEAPFAVR
jgi:hypothetical protein